MDYLNCLQFIYSIPFFLDSTTKYRIGLIYDNFTFWECFDSTQKAYKFFSQIFIMNRYKWTPDLTICKPDTACISPDSQQTVDILLLSSNFAPAYISRTEKLHSN